MAETIANALVPVFFVMLLGFGAGKAKIVDNLNIASLNTFLMWFALPLAMFVAIVKMPHTVIHANGPLMLVLAISLTTVFLGMLFVQTRWFGLSPGEAAVQSLTVASPNFAAVGPPLLQNVFGDQAMLAVAVAIATGSVTLSPVALTLLELDRTGRGKGSMLAGFFGALRRSAVKPIVLAPVAAVVLVLTGLGPSPSTDVGVDQRAYSWVLVLSSLDLLARASAGAALFMTGLILSAQPHTIDRNVVFSAVIANIVRPLVTVAVVMLLAPPTPETWPAAGEAVMLMSIPAGFFGIVFGSSFGVRPQIAGSTLVVSSLLSIATLSAAIYLVRIIVVSGQ